MRSYIIAAILLAACVLGYFVLKPKEPAYEGDDKRLLLTAAIAEYEKAIKIYANDHKTYYGWGFELCNLADADIEIGADEKRRLFTDAASKFEKATQLKDDFYEAYYGWGFAMYKLADLESNDAEKRGLLTDAIAKFEKVIEIKDDFHEAYSSCGGALGALAKLEPDPVKKADLFKRAVEVLERGESIQKGSGAYNLACCFALQGDPEQCRHWFEVAEQYGMLPAKAHVVKDSDLESVRDEEWFQDIKWPDSE